MQEVWLRRRANDHKDALRLILEPRFQMLGQADSVFAHFSLSI